MSLRVQELVEISLLSTGRYASVTNNEYFTWDTRATNYAMQMRLGNTNNAGKVDWTLAHAVENPDGDVTPAWQTLLTGAQLSVSSQVAVEFESQSIRPLLPYGRLQTIAKSGADADFTVADIVAHVMTEFK